MKIKQIFKYLIVAGGALLLIGVFLPFVSYNEFATSLFKLTESKNYEAYILIVFSIVAIVLPLLNKKIELVYITSGGITYMALTSLVNGISNDTFSSFSIGFYLLFIGGIVTGVFTYLYLTHEENEKSSVSATQNSSVAIQQPMDLPNPMDLIKDNLEQKTQEPSTEITSSVPLEPNQLNNDITLQNDAVQLSSIVPDTMPSTPALTVKNDSNIMTSEQSILGVLQNPAQMNPSQTISPLPAEFNTQDESFNNQSEVVNPVNQLFGSTPQNTMIQTDNKK